MLNLKKLNREQRKRLKKRNANIGRLIGKKVVPAKETFGEEITKPITKDLDKELPIGFDKLP